ncbi:MAG: DUF547 domain-containing protein [Ignavibacteriaceae bacterium]
MIFKKVTKMKAANKILKKFSFSLFVIFTFNNFAFGSSLKDFSHEIFNDLLNKNVSNGLVNYNGFKSQKFEEYLRSISEADLSGLNKNEKLAFWINSYNALAIKNVLNNPGMKSPIKVEGFFKEDKFEVAGKMLTLDQIENEVIRPEFKEPLIHFGIVCAAKGCPQIRSEAYNSKNVIEMLKENAKKYFRSDKGFILNRENKTVMVSQLLNWFDEDFKIEGKDSLKFVLLYLRKDDADFIIKNKEKLKIEFIEYDWSLNSQN